MTEKLRVADKLKVKSVKALRVTQQHRRGLTEFINPGGKQLHVRAESRWGSARLSAPSPTPTSDSATFSLPHSHTLSGAGAEPRSRKCRRKASWKT